MLVSYQVRLPRSLFVVQNRRPLKWLNIVLDINGILCETAHSPASSRGSGNRAEFSATVPAYIGPKSVYTRPGVREFLADIKTFLNTVVIWSSMKKSNSEEIVKYLFRDLYSPDLILGQDSCDKIQTSRNTFLMDQHNSEKMIFLKTLSSSLFNRRHELVDFNSDNTLLIDDSPEKSVCNHTGNAIFLHPWRRVVSNDTFLSQELVPWLRRLNFECPVGQLKEYVNSNRIGLPPLAPNSPLMKYIIDGMILSTKNIGVVYEIPDVYTPSATL